MGEMLLPQEKYLESGIHIGTKMKTPDMKKYIYKERQDKLYVLDLKQADERIRLAAGLISKYDPAKVYVVASRTYAGMAASKFAQITGCNIAKGRFIPGSMTNPARPNFFEPRLLVVCDPKNEWQSIREASATGTPVIALCDTDNTTRFIDLVLPCNNKGKKALALIFFLLAREVMKAKGLVASDAEFGHTLEEFDVPIERGASPAEAPAPEAPAGEKEAGELAEQGEGAKEKPGRRRAPRKKEDEGGEAQEEPPSPESVGASEQAGEEAAAGETEPSPGPEES